MQAVRSDQLNSSRREHGKAGQAEQEQISCLAGDDVQVVSKHSDSREGFAAGFRGDAQEDLGDDAAELAPAEDQRGKQPLAHPHTGKADAPARTAEKRSGEKARKAVPCAQAKGQQQHEREAERHQREGQQVEIIRHEADEREERGHADQAVDGLIRKQKQAAGGEHRHRRCRILQAHAKRHRAQQEIRGEKTGNQPSELPAGHQHQADDHQRELHIVQRHLDVGQVHDAKQQAQRQGIAMPVARVQNVPVHIGHARRIGTEGIPHALARLRMDFGTVAAEGLFRQGMISGIGGGLDHQDCGIVIQLCGFEAADQLRTALLPAEHGDALRGVFAHGGRVDQEGGGIARAAKEHGAYKERRSAEGAVADHGAAPPLSWSGRAFAFFSISAIWRQISSMDAMVSSEQPEAISPN